MSLPRALASLWENTTALIALSVNRSNAEAMIGEDRVLVDDDGERELKRVLGEIEMPK